MLYLSEQQNKTKGKKSTKTSVQKLESIRKRMDDISLDISRLIEELSLDHRKDKDTNSKKERNIKGTSLEISPKIEEILSKYEELEKEKFREYLLGFDLVTVKKIISENGYGIPKVTNKWKNKEKLVDYLIIELEKMSKKRNLISDAKNDTGIYNQNNLMEEVPFPDKEEGTKP